MVVELKEKEPIQNIIGDKPSRTSDRLFSQNVRHVDMTLRDFNSPALPNFPMTQKQFEEGLSLFVDWKNKKSEFSLFGTKEDGRSGSFRIRFSTIYWPCNYINIKGFGIPQFSYEAFHGDTIAKPGRGLAGYQSVKKDWDMSNIFLEKGVRVPVPLAIGNLQNTFLKDGREVGLADLVGRVISSDFISVLYFRGFIEVKRVEGATVDDLEDFAKRNGIEFAKYPSWWAGIEGDNLGRIHNLGKIHKFLGKRHNVTIAAEIGDFDSVVGIENAAGKGSFVEDACDMITTAMHIEDMCDTVPFSKAPSTFIERYFANFTNITKDDFSEFYGKYRPLIWKDTREEIAKLFEKRFGKKLE